MTGMGAKPSVRRRLDRAKGEGQVLVGEQWRAAIQLAIEFRIFARLYFTKKDEPYPAAPSSKINPIASSSATIRLQRFVKCSVNEPCSDTTSCRICLASVPFV